MPTKRIHRFRVTAGWVVLSLVLALSLVVPGCTGADGPSGGTASTARSRTTVRAAGGTSPPAPPTTVPPATEPSRQFVISQLAAAFGLDKPQQACAVDATLADPRLARADPATPRATTRLLVLHIIDCGARTAVLVPLVQRVSHDITPATRSCVLAALDAATPDELADLIAGVELAVTGIDRLCPGAAPVTTNAP